jgi:2'-5' RNA ligase
MPDSSQPSVEAALDIHVPEAEPLVAAFRDKHDPSTAKGMPAHITINYPFTPGVDPDESLYHELTKLFAAIASFSFTLNRFARFPGVTYLSPNPEAPFRQLIEAVAARFPESPPYGGAFDSIVPHLTIAHAEDEILLESIEHQLSGLAPQHLPMSIQVEQVLLMNNRTGRWQERKAFQLARR